MSTARSLKRAQGRLTVTQAKKKLEEWTRDGKIQQKVFFEAIKSLPLRKRLMVALRIVF